MEKKPQNPPREGRRGWKRPASFCSRYHSRAAGECRMQNAECRMDLHSAPRVLFGRKLCRARPLQRSQATACFVAVSRVEPWDVLDYLRLTPDTLRGEAFFALPRRRCKVRTIRGPAARSLSFRSLAPPLRTEPAALGFGSVWMGEPDLERSQASCPKK